MSPRPALNRQKRVHLRLGKTSAAHVEAQVKSGRFPTINDYFEWLVATHRTGEDLPMQEFQDAMVATMNKLRTDMRGDISSARRSAEASNAFVHALTKMMLVNNPEADQETRKLGQATAKRRYEKLLIAAAQELSSGNDE